MRSLDQPTARYLILSIAGIYILLLGCLQLGRLTGALDPVTAKELTQGATTLGSVAVGTVISFYLSSRLRQT
jgi:cytochrome c biogenesis protein CcdA